jgi:hypothetical protein
MPQTAVEWLQKQYDNCPESFLTDDDFEQAKAIEREQKHLTEIIKVIKKNRTHLYTIAEWYQLWFLMFAFGVLVGIVIIIIL